jgi:hypothetical protein
MMLRLALAVLLAASPLIACGVKTELDLPSEMKADKTRPDPSLPPQPLGR